MSNQDNKTDCTADAVVKHPSQDIQTTIQWFISTSKLYNALNTSIRDYYTPLLTKAAIDKDDDTFNNLMSELPDCPFVMTGYRIWHLYNG